MVAPTGAVIVRSGRFVSLPVDGKKNVAGPASGRRIDAVGFERQLILGVIHHGDYV